MMKTLSKLSLNLIKNVYKIIQLLYNSERPVAFPLRSGTKQGCSLYPLLFNIITEVPVNAIGQEKEIKDIQIGGKRK